MQRPTFLFLLTCCWYQTFGQSHIPTINATSASVDIRVGKDYFSKGGWILDPHKKPDVFSIGSQWPYHFKKVTFITDVDSISFDVQPGRNYDFIILLNQQTPCHIQIATLANPAFMNTDVIIPVLTGFGIFLLLAYVLRRRIKALPILYLGYAVPLLFWVVTIISGQLHGNYHHLKNVISELGAVGSKSEVFTSSSFVCLSLLSTLFSIGFYKALRTLKLSVLPAVLSFSKPISMTWAAIFPLGNEFHHVTGPLPFLTVLGSLSAFLLWKNGVGVSALRFTSLLCFLIMLLILTRFIRPFGLEYEGLVQRFFYFGWTVWMMALSYLLSEKLRERKRNKITNT
jgi:hypothetical membrane protein